MKFVYILFEMHASVSLSLDACPSVPYSAPPHDTYENQNTSTINNAALLIESQQVTTIDS
jgi:hypothetical protein